MEQLHASSSFKSFLEFLRSLAPARGVIHAGAGRGVDAALYEDWGVSECLLVEADEAHEKALAALSARHAGWSASTTLLNAEKAALAFHVASNPNESGILSPLELNGLWRNLRSKEQRFLPATTLDDLLRQQGERGRSFNWLYVDCLPALPVLKGGTTVLGQCDVVIARVVLGDGLRSGTGALRNEVDELLMGADFKCVAVEPERHPAVALAVYVRDWPGLCERERRVARETSSRQDKALKSLSDEKRQMTLQTAEREHEVARLRESAKSLEGALRAKELSVEEQAKLLLAKHTEVQRVLAERDRHAQQAEANSDRASQILKERDRHAQRADSLEQEVARLVSELQLAAGGAANFSREIQNLKALAAKSEAASGSLQARNDEYGIKVVELEAELEKARSQLKAVQRERDEEARSSCESLAELDRLVETRDDLHRSLEQLRVQLASALAEVEREAQAAKARAVELEEVARQRDQHASTAEQRQLQIETLEALAVKSEAASKDLQARNDECGIKLVEIKAELEKARSQLKAVQRERDEEARSSCERLAELDRLVETRDDLHRSLEHLRVQLASALAEVEREAQAAKARAIELEEVAGQRDQHGSAAAAMQGQIAAVLLERDSHAQRATALQSQVSDILAERDLHAQRADQAQAELQRLTAEHARRTTEATNQERRLFEELRESRQTAALSVRMQTLKEADLRDLQTRYLSAMAIQEEQHQLLAKLSERLGAASAYFHQLALADAASVRLAGNRRRTPSNSDISSSTAIDSPPLVSPSKKARKVSR
jgi:chromosome segregation ATPase